MPTSGNDPLISRFRSARFGRALSSSEALAEPSSRACRVGCAVGSSLRQGEKDDSIAFRLILLTAASRHRASLHSVAQRSAETWPPVLEPGHRSTGATTTAARPCPHADSEMLVALRLLQYCVSRFCREALVGSPYSVDWGRTTSTTLHPTEKPRAFVIIQLFNSGEQLNSISHFSLADAGATALTFSHKLYF